MPASIWPTLIYDDAPAAIEWLRAAFGFEIALVVPNDVDPTVIEHCQLRWPHGGGVMLGSAGRPCNPFSERQTGAAGVYAVTPEPDALYDRCTAAGAVVFQEIQDEDYGNRGFAVTDPEGNVWSFGHYAGE